MKIVIDIEADGLENPQHIWLVVCKDIETGEYYYFRNITENPYEKERFISFLNDVELFIGHNFLSFDYPVISGLLSWTCSDVALRSCDTLIVSKLVDYSRPEGHAIADYGTEFGIEKGDFINFTSKELFNSSTVLFKKLEVYCKRDVDICHKVYLKYLKYIKDPLHKASILMEHKFQLVVNSLSDNGFSFNTKKAESLLSKVKEELEVLDKEILKEFPSKLKLIREVTPEVTKHGTLNRKDFRWVEGGDLSEFNGGPFCRCKWEQFNPSSHQQIVGVLTKANWQPIDKTQTHIDTERALNRLKYSRKEGNELDFKVLSDKLKILQKSGWKINENNLNTLPIHAPKPARTLARRILIESRRRTLTEWLGLVSPYGRIHGTFYGIGAWTHRMAHQKPNTANIPTDVKLYGKEMRALWQAPKGRLLVGVDAEGIQLRIFAHYINDLEFTDALVRGTKVQKTDPHSLNQRILGRVCKSRQDAKRFIYALLLGAGVQKLSQILGCSLDETKEALGRLLERYTGLALLKTETIPKDAKRGWFIGLDGRKVAIPGDTVGERKHLCMSGYLQNGEAVVMKNACLRWHDLLKEKNSILVNFVHDEWQTECPNNMNIALELASIQADSLREVGEELGLNCPLAGSYWNEERNDYTIGTKWSVTH